MQLQKVKPLFLPSFVILDATLDVRAIVIVYVVSKDSIQKTVSFGGLITQKVCNRICLNWWGWIRFIISEGHSMLLPGGRGGVGEEGVWGVGDGAGVAGEKGK